MTDPSLLPLVARLLVPALRWSEDTGFDHEAPAIDAALEAGVGGFILFGGEAAAVRDLVDDLRARASWPLLVAADLERGAGQQFRGCTALPPAGALGRLHDVEAVYDAAYMTAQEARALGVDLVFAPVCDLDVEPRNPIVGARAFGTDPREVARAVTAWIQGCRDGGALACAKHFPGHGRTTADSHLELPEVDLPLRRLASDLVPFAAAVEAGVPSVMTAHVAYPSLDPVGRPATLSRPILHGLLRERLGFRGAVVSDALVMEGFARTDDPPEPGWSRPHLALVEALAAGVDLLLYPPDASEAAGVLRRALEERRVEPARVRTALERRDALLAARSDTDAPGPDAPEFGLEAGAARARSRELAQRAVRIPAGLARRVPGPAPGPGGEPTPVDLVLVDDDVGGPYAAPSRSPLVEGLRRHGFGVELRESARGGDPDRDGADHRSTWLAVFADTRGWKGRAGLSSRALRRIREELPFVELVLLFGHPRIGTELGGTEPHEGVPVVCAWGGEALMQEAAARAVAEALGSTPVP